MSDPEPVVVPAEDVHRAIRDTLLRHGATGGDAQLQADMLLEADLRAQPSHGIRRLPVLVERLARQATTSGVPPTLEWRAPGALHVDGHRGLGPAVAHRALDELIPRAQGLGVATASISSAGHVGMLAPYVERIAAENCVGIALTVSEALVHPWGGSRAVVGTNPIGIGIPTAGEPLVLDMSTATVSAGKILDYAGRGERIPLGWAVDETGMPTTDASRASRGAISPFGGPKGYALGIALGAMVGLLSDTSYGRDVTGTLDVIHPPTKGDLFVVISVGALGGPGALEKLAAYLDSVRAEATDERPVVVPGDRARAERVRRLRDGVPIDGDVWAEVNRLRTGTTAGSR